ncbi:2-hydroxyacid dehydrogenase [Azospirillum sp. SYSU D00513]|uniref:2-hydroxyacid dehydrogenase n=1 Tax=Azospirillum sp. SYSU D00513 TaxID=2812561 RepID=UPI001FFEDFFD|nr:2-hydroxyacid dehydrogenase [Azospirillum sp. SYSU D00513]
MSMQETGGAPVEILQTSPFALRSPEAFEATFKVHKLWEASDREALLREVGPRVRGIAAGGKVEIDAAFMDTFPALEVVANFGVGYDRVDVAAAAARGVVVTNTPDVLTDEVADLTLGLLLATVRRLPQADRFLREGRWLKGAFPLSASLRGRRVGILGLGRIGKAIAKRCAAFELEVVYHGRSRQEGVPYGYYPSLVEMARAVEVLIVIAPGGAGTDGLVGAEVLDALGPNGILINVARGTVVDERALIAALTEGRILAAGLDVFEKEPQVPSELIALDNVVLLPHVGSASLHTRQAMGQLLLDNLEAWFAGRGPLTPVPETPWTGQPAPVG